MISLAEHDADLGFFIELLIKRINDALHLVLGKVKFSKILDTLKSRKFSKILEYSRML